MRPPQPRPAVYHPFDPVGHRLEPLAVPAPALQRALHLPLFRGGKRIHLAVQARLAFNAAAAHALLVTV